MKRILSVLVLSLLLLPVAVPWSAAASTVSVSDWSGFARAIQTEGAVISLTTDIFSPQGSGDDAVFLPKGVTIQGNGNTITLNAGGIVLGGDVTFENVNIACANAVRNAIIANGYTLTLNGVKQNGAFGLHLFCGGISDYNGGNAASLPAAGDDGRVVIQGACALGDIFAGSLSDLGSGAEDKSNSFTGSATITVDRAASGSVGAIYAYGARENRTGSLIGGGTDANVSGDQFLPGDTLYTVSGSVAVELKDTIAKTVYGTAATTVSCTDNGKGNSFSPTLYGIGALTLCSGTDTARTNLSLPSACSFGTVGPTLTVQSNAILDLSGLGDRVTAASLSGGGILVLGQSQTLTVTGAVSGTTKVAVGSLGYGDASGSLVQTEHAYIAAAGSVDSSFLLLPDNLNDTYVLSRDSSGGWTAGEPADSEIRVTSVTLPDALTVEMDNTGAQIPLTVTYQKRPAANWYLAHVPIPVTVNGTAMDQVGTGDYVYYPPEEAETAFPVSFMAIYQQESDASQEYLLVEGQGSGCALAEGTYAIQLTIPGDYMADGEDEVLTTTLTVRGLVYTPGDVNEDGKLTIADAVLVARSLQGEEDFTPAQRKAADYDGNGSVTTADVAALCEAIAGDP